MKKIKDTLNLPKTGFSMKANLAQKEPEMIKYWEEIKLYDLLQSKNKDGPNFLLHDGPPYANGPIHLGTTNNKVLKDIIIKFKQLQGFNSPYIPGWDCHGLPIELNVEKKIGKVNVEVPADKFREECREYANQQIAIQRNDFKRLGIQADWKNPYKTMSFDYEANTIRALGKIIEANHLVRGEKPVYWCSECKSALAEAEVEYYDKESKAIDFLFPMQKEVLENLLSLEINSPTFAASWTTTPWTIPSNQAISFNPEFQYELIEFEHEKSQIAVLVASTLKERTLERIDVGSHNVLGKLPGSALNEIEANHPFLKDSFNINYNDYKLDVTTINNIKPYLENDLKIKIIMGTWCDDSRLLVPQFLKVMDKLKFKKNKIEFIGLDHEKNSPYDHDKIYEIINVPTIIFYKDDMEFNRIVELTIETLEKDILSILSDSGYENAYYGF